METDNDLHLGILTDSLNSEIPQEELNEDLLKEHNQYILLNSIKNRLSSYYLSYLLEEVSKTDSILWDNILEELIRVYSLNYLKIKHDIFVYESYLEKIKDIITLLIYIKIRLIRHIDNGKFKESIKHDKFLDLLIEDKAPNTLVELIKYSDNESYKKFVSRLFLEQKLDFMD
jgi:hypothetical protein